MKMYLDTLVLETMWNTVLSDNIILREEGFKFSFSWKENDEKKLQGIMCHGAEDGTLAYKGRSMTIQQLANELEKEGEIGSVYLISCHPKQKTTANTVVSNKGNIKLHNMLSDCSSSLYAGRDLVKGALSIGRHC